jgi:5'-nucleotidase
VHGMRVLVTNDDGIHAPGIALLERIAATLSDDVWVVAPELEQSGAAHSLSLSDPLRLRELSAKKFAVRGSPTDCAVLACNYLMQDRKPDLLLSGINRGANLADDATYSGTIAAAMEGTILGIPSIAMSQVFTRGQPVPWQTAETFCPIVLAHVLPLRLPKGVLVNINFPDVAPDRVRGFRVTRQGQRTRQEIAVLDRVDGRGVPYFWLSFQHEASGPPAHTDLGAVAEGMISITPLHLDLTHEATIGTLEQALAHAPLARNDG